MAQIVRIGLTLAVWSTAAALFSEEAVADYRQAVEATVRITGSDGIGTGVVFSVSEQAIFALTNAHVVSSGDREHRRLPALGSPVKVEFWRDGHQVGPITGRVEWCSYKQDSARDLAVITIARRDLGWSPPAIPLAQSVRLEPDAAVLTVGCAEGAWPTAALGHVLRATDSAVWFVPTPAHGRSGSALFDPAGKTIVGLVGWTATDKTCGKAISIAEIDRAARGEAPAIDVITDDGWRGAVLPGPAVPGPVDDDDTLSVIEVPNTCPPGGCRPQREFFLVPPSSPQRPFARNGAGDDYQRPFQLRPTTPTDPPPTLPPREPPPVKPELHVDEAPPLPLAPRATKAIGDVLTPGLIALLVGAGVPGWLAAVLIWFARRGGRKVITYVAADLHAHHQAPAPTPSERTHGQPVSTGPTQINFENTYALSDAYAKELADKRANAGASTAQEALLAQLYRECFAGIKSGALKTLGGANVVNDVEAWVTKEFMRRHGVRL